MLTEDEARKKICPASFNKPDVYGPDGCGIQQGGPWNCCASDCMAWRWLDAETKYESVTVYDQDGEEGPAPDGEGWKRGRRTGSALSSPGVVYSREVVLGANRRGCCGLAGQP